MLRCLVKTTYKRFGLHKFTYADRRLYEVTVLASLSLLLTLSTFHRVSTAKTSQITYQLLVSKSTALYPQSSPKISHPHHAPTFDHFLHLETCSLSGFCVTRLSWFYSILCSLTFSPCLSMLTSSQVIPFSSIPFI